MSSRIPACSPALTKFTYKSLKWSGCLPSASVSEPPASTSPFTDKINFCIAGFSCPLPTISNDCTSGTPADIIVASCRLNTVMSLVSIFPFAPNKGLGFFFSLVGFIPCFLSAVLAAASLGAAISPVTFLVLLSRPSQIKKTSLFLSDTDFTLQLLG